VLIHRFIDLAHERRILVHPRLAVLTREVALPGRNHAGLAVHPLHADRGQLARHFGGHVAVAGDGDAHIERINVCDAFHRKREMGVLKINAGRMGPPTHPAGLTWLRRAVNLRNAREWFGRN
jgi:hypothetical protein